MEFVTDFVTFRMIFYWYVNTYMVHKKIEEMRKMIALFAYVFTIGFVGAQKVYTVDYESQAHVKVFVVDYESQADLKVYKVKYESQAGQNDGKWFFTEYESQSKKKIYFVKYESQSDLKIYFVEYESQSGWKNSSKKHLMY